MCPKYGHFKIRHFKACEIWTSPVFAHLLYALTSTFCLVPLNSVIISESFGLSSSVGIGNSGVGNPSLKWSEQTAILPLVFVSRWRSGKRQTSLEWMSETQTFESRTCLKFGCYSKEVGWRKCPKSELKNCIMQTRSSKLDHFICKILYWKWSRIANHSV